MSKSPHIFSVESAQMSQGRQCKTCRRNEALTQKFSKHLCVESVQEKYLFALGVGFMAIFGESARLLKIRTKREWYSSFHAKSFDSCFISKGRLRWKERRSFHF